MVASSQITPGMTISIKNKIYRVESCLPVKVQRGASFVKTKLRDLITDKVIERNFKFDQEIIEVSLEEKNLEFLYPEEKTYLFLDIDNLDIVSIPSNILGDKINFLKEGVEVKAKFYGEAVYFVELPMFLELMVVKTQNISKKLTVSNSMKKAVLETGAEIEVPLFVEPGDVIKIDARKYEYIQRV